MCLWAILINGSKEQYNPATSNIPGSIGFDADDPLRRRATVYQIATKYRLRIMTTLTTPIIVPLMDVGSTLATLAIEPDNVLNSLFVSGVNILGKGLVVESELVT